MNAPLYTTQVLRLAASLDAPRSLDREDGRAELRSPACGSRVATAVTIDPDGRVLAVSQQVHACAFGQASSALLERSAVGRSREDIAIAIAEIGGWLNGAQVEPSWPGIADLAPARSKTGRHGAIVLPFRTLLAAIDDAR